MAKVIELKKDTSQKKYQERSPTDDYNPLEGAKFSSEISKYIGPYKSPAKAYEEIIGFRQRSVKNSASEES